jgi:poly(3-hydroxyalkanoate) synthetase
MKERLIYANNSDGWGLELRQYWDSETHDATRRPLLLIPGYCMNTFILNFHPRGDSMVRFLTRHGFEVWTANLRGQGGSQRHVRRRKFGFRELCLVDLPVVLDTVQRRNRSGNQKIDAIGCSLGATFLFAYLAHHLDTHPFGSLVTLGGPLRWESAHPALELAFASPAFAGAIKVAGTRSVAKRLLPLVKKVPSVLSIYMNAENINLEAADQLVQTIDDPVPYLNKQIAHWVRTRDLYVGGVNVTKAMKHVDVPLLCVAANNDGIVPQDTAISAINAFGTDDVETLRVGDKKNWFAHADLFVNDEAEERVFEPLASWLDSKK